MSQNERAKDRKAAIVEWLTSDNTKDWLCILGTPLFMLTIGLVPCQS